MAGQLGMGQCLSTVMPGLVPGIHVLGSSSKAWIAGTSPVMTVENLALEFGILRASIEGRSFHGK
jgi:hypothetical protein